MQSDGFLLFITPTSKKQIYLFPPLKLHTRKSAQIN